MVYPRIRGRRFDVGGLDPDTLSRLAPAGPRTQGRIAANAFEFRARCGAAGLFAEPDHDQLDLAVITGRGQVRSVALARPRRGLTLLERIPIAGPGENVVALRDLPQKEGAMQTTSDKSSAGQELRPLVVIRENKEPTHRHPGHK